MERKQTMEHTSLLVLSLLQGQDLYGYQMITELERRSDHTFQMKEGTLYPVLKKLENRGYVTAYQAEGQRPHPEILPPHRPGPEGAGAGEGPVGKLRPRGSTPSSPSSRDEPGSGEVPGLRGGRVRLPLPRHPAGEPPSARSSWTTSPTIPRPFWTPAVPRKLLFTKNFIYFGRSRFLLSAIFFHHHFYASSFL